MLKTVLCYYWENMSGMIQNNRPADKLSNKSLCETPSGVKYQGMRYTDGKKVINIAT